MTVVMAWLLRTAVRTSKQRSRQADCELGDSAQDVSPRPGTIRSTANAIGAARAEATDHASRRSTVSFASDAERNERDPGINIQPIRYSPSLLFHPKEATAPRPHRRNEAKQRKHNERQETQEHQNRSADAALLGVLHSHPRLHRLTVSRGSRECYCPNVGLCITAEGGRGCYFKSRRAGATGLLLSHR